MSQCDPVQLFVVLPAQSDDVYDASSFESFILSEGGCSVLAGFRVVDLRDKLIAITVVPTFGADAALADAAEKLRRFTVLTHKAGVPAKSRLEAERFLDAQLSGVEGLTVSAALAVAVVGAALA